MFISVQMHKRNNYYVFGKIKCFQRTESYNSECRVLQDSVYSLLREFSVTKINEKCNRNPRIIPN